MTPRNPEARSLHNRNSNDQPSAHHSITNSQDSMRLRPIMADAVLGGWARYFPCQANDRCQLAVAISFARAPLSTA